MTVCRNPLFDLSVRTGPPDRSARAGHITRPP